MTNQDVREDCEGCAGCADCDCGHKQDKPKRLSLRERYYRLSPDARWSIGSLALIAALAVAVLTIDVQTGYLRFMQENAPRANFRLVHDIVTFACGVIIGIYCTFGTKKSEG